MTSFRNDGANAKLLKVPVMLPVFIQKNTCHWAKSPIVNTDSQVSVLTSDGLVARRPNPGDGLKGMGSS